MQLLTHSRLLQQRRALYRVVLLALAGGIMLVASILPWFIEPLGQRYCAWQLPLDLGWQLRSPLVNYGLLCLCCTLLLWRRAGQLWRLRLAEERYASSQQAFALQPDLAAATRSVIFTGLLCLLPVALYILQYLFNDLSSIAHWSDAARQALLIRSHFGYGSAAQLIPLQVTTFDPATLSDRFALLINQSYIGVILPLLASGVALASRSLFPSAAQNRYRVQASGYTRRLSVRAGREQAGDALPMRRQRYRIWLLAGVALLLLLALSRGALAFLSSGEAERELQMGNYPKALSWLDTAHWLNPALDSLPQYHIARGQAEYYLHPQQPDTDSQLYLAAFYLKQADYLAAYQQLLSLRNNGARAQWIDDQLRIVLQRLAEMSHPLNGEATKRAQREQAALTWLTQIVKLDANNVYAHYMLGRIQYDLHNYEACSTQMRTILDLSQEADFQSAAYTYLGLSSSALGDMHTARSYLFKAQDLDPTFRNNIAREELSGLR